MAYIGNKPTDRPLTRSQLAADLVDGTKIADDAVDSEHYAADSIDAEHYNAGSVDTTALGADAVTAAKLADDAVVTANIVDVNITTAKIADNAVTLAKMAGLARGKVIVGDSSGDPAALALGTSGYVLKSDGTDAAWAADAGLSTEEVQDIAGGMFTGNTETGITVTYQDADGTVDLVIGAGDIVNSMLADDAVDSDELAAGAVDAAHLASDSVTEAKVAANSIDSQAYVDGSIDKAHLSTAMGDCSDRGFTNIGLNSGDKITFTDNTDMRFTVNAGEEMRLEADGDLHVDGDVIAYSTTISDATLKYNINPVEFALDKIKQLKGVTFNYLKGNKASAGLLAQDVEKVMPSAVSERKLPLHTDDNKSYKTLHYDSMTAILVEAIKELTAKVEKLENK